MMDPRTAAHPARYGVTRRAFNAIAGFLVAVGVMAVPPALAQGTAMGADDQTRTIVVLGDSLSAGYGLQREDAFTTKLESALRAKGYDVRVPNTGVSGETTAGGLARLDWVLADKPDLMVVALGGNDGLRGIDPAATRDNLDKILGKLQAQKVPTVLAGMLAPRNLGRVYGEAFDALYPALAEKYGVAFYPFLLEGVAVNPDLNQADGIHPNAKGVDVMVAGILPVIAGLLDRSAPGTAGTPGAASGGR